MSDQIYFIQGETSELIKIGITYNIEQRLKGLKTMLTEKIKIIAVAQGNWKHEQEIHSMFHKFRVNGEWFKPSPELLAFIEFVNEKSFFPRDNVKVLYWQFMNPNGSEKEDKTILNDQNSSDYDDILLTVEQVCRKLSMSTSTFLNTVRSNQGPPCVILPNKNNKTTPSFWRFRKSHIDEWIENIFRERKFEWK